MIEGRASRTAERVARRRAAHQLMDHPVVHSDPMALAILDEAVAAEIRADPARAEDGRFDSFLRAFLAVRSRIAEDTLASAVAAGVRQYVVLGAGLDTFAYRNPHAGLRVFEVDHPATQAWKRELLAGGRVAVPESVVFVAVDFSRETLLEKLGAAGWKKEEPTFFSWLGVVPYLETATVMETLGAIMPFTRGGGGVVFDYGVPPSSLPWIQRKILEAVAARVAAAGEPFRSYFEPGPLVEAVKGLGYREVRKWGPGELNGVFFANRRDGLRVGNSGYVLVARG